MTDSTETRVATKKAASAKPKTETVDKDFIYETHLDADRRIPGTSVYLDDVQRRDAETLRAAAEDREPDYENPGSTQGTPLQSFDALAATLPPGFEKSNEIPVVTLPVVVSKTNTVSK